MEAILYANDDSLHGFEQERRHYLNLPQGRLAAADRYGYDHDQ